MYTPPHFEEVRESEILKIIENFPLATLVCTKDSDLIINHIPLIRLSSTTYLGHIAKANPLHSLFPAGVDATAVFSTENSYVSPNWYPSKALSHRHVPTWNYQVVHLIGRLNFDFSHKARLRLVQALLAYLFSRLLRFRSQSTQHFFSPTWTSYSLIIQKPLSVWITLILKGELSWWRKARRG